MGDLVIDHPKRIWRWTDKDGNPIGYNVGSVAVTGLWTTSYQFGDRPNKATPENVLMRVEPSGRSWKVSIVWGYGFDHHQIYIDGNLVWDKPQGVNEWEHLSTLIPMTGGETLSTYLPFALVIGTAVLGSFAAIRRRKTW